MFSCEYYKIFKNTYFEEHLQTITSGTLLHDTKFQFTFYIQKLIFYLYKKIALHKQVSFFNVTFFNFIVTAHLHLQKL